MKHQEEDAETVKENNQKVIQNISKYFTSMLAEGSLLQRNLMFKQVAEFVAEQFLSTGIKQQVSQYFEGN